MTQGNMTSCPILRFACRSTPAVTSEVQAQMRASRVWVRTVTHDGATQHVTSWKAHPDVQNMDEFAALCKRCDHTFIGEL